MAFFASGVKGAWYERSNIASLYQESTGVTPGVVGGPVGLGLSREQGPPGALVARSDLAAAWSNADARWTYSAGSVVWTGGGGANSNTTKLLLDSSYFGKFVKLVFAISGYSGSNTIGIDSGTLSSLPNDTAGAGAIDTRVTANGTYTFRGFWRGGGNVNGRTLVLLGRGSANFTLTINEISEILGNHQIQASPGLRPLHQTGPKRLVFDGVDDVLNTAFTTALGVNCTVGRAIPGTGAVITSGVNIGTTFADNVTAGALLIADRALTAAEDALWRAYLNQQSVL